MAWEKNITGVAEGSYRSLNGAADESIFQGRASKAGYFCFFKVWRDMPYDAVLDHAGTLYRVEVKVPVETILWLLVAEEPDSK